MGISFYSLKRALSKDPKTLAELRDVQRDKLAQFKGGTFVFTMEAEDKSPALSKDDKRPALVISWTGAADDKDYWKSVVKAQKQIKGTLVADKGVKSYAFVADDASKKQLDEYLKDKDALSIALWNLIGPGANLVSIGSGSDRKKDTPLTKRTLKDASWTLAEWRVARVLVTDHSLFDKAPIPGTKPVTQDGKQWHMLPHGLLIPQDLAITVTAAGKMVEKAEQNEHSAAFIRDHVADVFKPLVEKLGAELVKLDLAMAKEEAQDKKLKLAEQADHIFDKFYADAQKAILASAQQQWITLLVAKVEYRDFQIDMGVKITKGVVSLALSVTAASLGGATGVGAILGLVGTIKGGLETANTIYTAFRDVEGMGDEINTQLANALASKNAAGWKDFGKTILGTLPGGKVVQSALAKGGLAVRPVKDIKADLKAYNGKVAGLLDKANGLGATVGAALKQSETALKALDAPAVLALEKTDPKLKKRNDTLRHNIGQTTTDFLDKIGKLTQQFNEGKAKVEEYKKLVELLEKEVKQDVYAEALKKYFTPLLNLPWGVNPANLPNTITSACTVALDMVTPLVTALTEDPNTTTQTADWVKTGADLAKNINKLVIAVNKLKH